MSNAAIITDVETRQLEYETLKHTDLRNLFDRVAREAQRMDDLVIPSDALYMRDDGTFVLRDAPGLALTDDEIESLYGKLDAEAKETVRSSRLDRDYDALPLFHRQLGMRLSIPYKYYTRMKDTAPVLLAENVNTWLSHPDESRNFLLRTMRPPDGSTDRGILRALLSDKYLILNNHDVILTALAKIRDMGLSVNVKRCDLTETRMYVAVECPDISIDAKPFLKRYRHPQSGEDGGGSPSGYNITAGFVISNSEVGHGAFQIQPRPFANICFNALTISAHSMRRNHLGSRLDEGAVTSSEETRRLNFELIKSQVGDALETFCTADYLNKVVSELDGTEEKLDHPVHAVNNCADYLGMNDDEKNDLIEAFMSSGDTSGFGLLQAVTFDAQQHDPDRMYEQEARFGDLLGKLQTFDVAPEQVN